jgi:CheY-like chemotaxis protein
MQQTPASAPTILVVEDEPLVRLIGTLLLADEGYRVLEACNADVALHMLEENPGIDIVFTDIEMPGALDGLGLARCIHERWPSISVIVTSGRYQPAAGRTESGDVFVPKPYGLNTLLPEIAACLSKTPVAA